MAKFLDKAGLKRALSGFWTGAKAYADEVSRVAAAADTELNKKIGDLSELTTTAKNNVVAASNELKSGINGILATEGQTKDSASIKGAKLYADSLASNYDASGSAATAEQNAKDYADGLAGNYIASNLKGAANGVAELGSDGKVPASQLPSYVDDVLEYSKLSAFPTTGESGKIYVAQETNLTYRWSGSAYVEISQSLALGETSSTAYAGDKGKANAEAIAAHTARTDNPHSVTAAQVGLDSVVNTGDSATPVEGGTTKFTTGGAYTELAKKVDKVEGMGLSHNDLTDTLKSGYDDAVSKKHTHANKAELDKIADGDKAKWDAYATSKVDVETGKSLIADTEITRLAGIETGAQVNKIETVKVDNVALTITDKAVNIDLSGKVAKTQTIAGVDMQDNITKAEMLTALNVADGATADEALSNDEIDAVIAEIFPAA